MAGVVAPIAGLGGEHTAVPMALIILVLVGGSLTALFGLTRREPRLTHDHVLATN
jgi:DHA1 family bicyclomycin/chloramphenicol resistance-like MFS transporter